MGQALAANLAAFEEAVRRVLGTYAQERKS